jgi:hypothetical protein
MSLVSLLVHHEEKNSPPYNINQNGNKVKVVTSENSLTNHTFDDHIYILVTFQGGEIRSWAVS